jgi:hypothetical protein
MFCAPIFVLECTDGVGLRFHVWCSRTRFGLYRWRRAPVFMFHAPRLVFDGTEVAGSRFHVWRSQTHFGLYRVRRVPFSCFAIPNSFRAVPRASGPIYMFCAPGVIFDDTEGVGSRFHVLPSRTGFRCNRGRQAPFACLRFRTHFRQYRGRRVPLPCFAHPD